MRSTLGIARSLLVYWRPGRQPGLRRLYAPFLGPGSLVFDVGAHLGDRSAAFASLGARVVALEPQPAVARWLRRIVGRNPRIEILEEAVGRVEGTATLSVSGTHPTVSTLSEAWRDEMPGRNPGFRGVRWTETVTVPVTTLDRLAERFGHPDFCKLDIEGHEAEALAGLSRPVPALSFEFVRGGLDVARACVDRLEALAPYRFNVAAAEERVMHFPAWRTPDEVRRWLEAGAEDLPFGDIYARLARPEAK